MIMLNVVRLIWMVSDNYNGYENKPIAKAKKEEIR